MRVFVTGATGFIGFAIVQELIAAGHQVTGLARSEDSGKKLTDAGARVAVGSVDDLDLLRRSAARADAAIHTAFYHKISHIPFGKRMGVFLGGAHTGIVQRFMMAAVETDRLALKTLVKRYPEQTGLYWLRSQPWRCDQGSSLPRINPTTPPSSRLPEPRQKTP
jgi:NAD(P)-dependent dehydrogenase (short-subunit alcohol dehydrogenase family)